MTRDSRVAQRLRLAHEYLAWMSARASEVPTLAGAIARTTEELDYVEAVLRNGEHEMADTALADTILRFMEQRLLDLGASIATRR